MAQSCLVTCCARRAARQTVMPLTPVAAAAAAVQARQHHHHQQQLPHRRRRQLPRWMPCWRPFGPTTPPITSSVAVAPWTRTTRPACLQTRLCHSGVWSGSKRTSQTWERCCESRRPSGLRAFLCRAACMHALSAACGPMPAHAAAAARVPHCCCPVTALRHPLLSALTLICPSHAGR